MAGGFLHLVLLLLLRPNLVGYCQAQYTQNTITHESHRTMPFVCQGINYYANFEKRKREALKVHPFTWGKLVMNHFQLNHYRDETGRFVIPLPKKEGVEPLGECREVAVRRILSLEKSLRLKGSRNLLRLCKNTSIWGTQSQCQWSNW